MKWKGVPNMGNKIMTKFLPIKNKLKRENILYIVVSRGCKPDMG